MQSPANILNNAILLLVAAAIGFRVSAQYERVSFEKISLEAGLSQVNVRCILQDRSGFMWFGTQDGLNRYDGYEFVKFKWNSSDSGSLPGNLVSALTEDINGNILIGTMGGLAIYNPYTNKLRRMKVRNSQGVALPGHISSFSSGENGVIWIGDFQSGVYIYKPNTDELESLQADITEINNIAKSKVMAVAADDRGRVWIGTFSGGLFHYLPDKGAVYHFPLPFESIGSESITSLYYSRNLLMIGTLNGLYILNQLTNKIEYYKHNPNDKYSLSSNHILSIFVDNDERSWIGTENGGLNVFEEKYRRFYTFKTEPGNPNTISDNTIFSIYRDRARNLWIGTASSGLNKFNLRPGKFQSISRRDERNGKLKNYSIRAILVDDQRQLWLGTDNGLYCFDSTAKLKKSFFNIRGDKRSLNDNKVWAICTDRKGDLWIGTHKGLAKYEKSTNNFTRFNFPENHSDESPVFMIRSLFADKNNDLWIGTYGAGLFHFSPSKKLITPYLPKITNPDAIKDIVIFQLYEDNSGKLWLAAPSGLASFDLASNQYERYFTESPSDFPAQFKPLYSLFDAGDNSLWLGTLGDGLIKFNLKEKTFSRLTEQDGLANNVIYGILPDQRGNLWLSTNNGISRLSPETISFKNYSVDDGMPGSEFNTGAFFKDNQNNLYFGGTEGLVYFNPELVTENTLIPQIAVTSFRVFDRPINKNRIFRDRDTIILSYYDNYFSIEFAALDFTSPQKNQYSYILEGYETSWIKSGKRRYAAYTNLDPGNYNFRIQASNNDAYWNTKGISITIIIEPPFYLTWWFRFLTISLIALIIGFVYRRRIESLKNETAIQQEFTKQLIESQESERFRIASELHDGLGQNLLTIINRSKMALKKQVDIVTEKQLAAISETAQDSIEEVRRISRNLHPYQLGSVGLTKTIEATIKNLEDASGIEIIREIELIDELFNDEQQINIFRIVQEGFSNIVKHSGAASAKLCIKIIPGSVSILITDNGKGLKPSQLQHILNKSKGFGLLGIRQRVAFLNGSIDISSSENKGMTLLINIPVSKILSKNEQK
ncbi:MAG: hypothetical protein HUU54_11005 [Ignavibacteriaceae bacterium]|nr:hypothetical protein [Ignavibacteriaceae bacterium]